jgi:hypothetical protein
MGNVLILSELLLQWLDKAMQVSQLLKTAHAEGRGITDAEMAQLFADDDAARKQLQDTIDARKAEEAAKP